MNRTDQAPEPTMEEILASIRLIIFDDAKNGSVVREEQPARLAAPKPEAPSLDTLPAEEVLDLSESLACPENQATPVEVGEHRRAPLSHHVATETVQPDTAAEEPAEADMPPSEESQGPHEPRLPFAHPAPAASHTIWSRRDLPGSPPPAALAPKLDTPAKQPQKSWPQDIQMPIPDRGPVSLIPGQGQPQETAEVNLDAAPNAGRDGGQPAPLDEMGEAAVAAIAESLARSAAEAMDSEELATAHDVDFSKLDEERKAEVAETFANAIEREKAPRDTSPLPTLLDEVFRQDFIHEPLQEAKAPERKAEPDASGASEDDSRPESEESFAPRWAAPDVTMRTSPRPQQAPLRAEASLVASETAPTQQDLPVKAVPLVPQEPEAPRPAASASPLENVVRDMLRPLLVQWLDEHMPRILESAIREEITTRGLLPKIEK